MEVSTERRQQQQQQSKVRQRISRHDMAFMIELLHL